VSAWEFGTRSSLEYILRHLIVGGTLVKLASFLPIVMDHGARPKMTAHRIARILVAAALASLTLPVGSGPLHAESNSYERMQNRLLSRRTGIDIRALEARDRRLDYQTQQRFNRELERRDIGPIPLRVPTMRPTCRLPVYGNAYMGARCR
jgi:hypothetical protein